MLGNFSDMFSKLKESFKQTINLKVINEELKNISEDFLSLLKTNNSEIENENNYRKYELSYKHESKSDHEVESNNILYLALVSFHQKKGSVIELTFPPMEKIIKEPQDELKDLIEENKSDNNNVESIINNINSQLVNYSLMDGIHLVDNDTQIYFLHNFKKPIYCLSYYVQVKTGSGHSPKEDSFQENVRECIQKALCVISLKPVFTHKLLYQNIYTYLTTQMNSFMEQESLNDKIKLNILYDILSRNIILIDLDKDIWLLNLRKLFCLLKNDIFTILKLILSEQNIIIYSQIPSNVSLSIMALLSILPGQICQGLSDYDIQNESPFRIFHENYLIYPLFTLFDLSPLIEKLKQNEKLHYFIGTTNLLIAKSKDINYSCLIDVDELKITYNENLNEDIIYVNSYENKIGDEINKKISNNINKDDSNKNFEYNKKCNIKEDWIIAADSVKEEYIKEYKFMLKKIRLYFLNISYDVIYLINETKLIKDNNDQNKPLIKLKEMNEQIKNNYIKSIPLLEDKSDKKMDNKENEVNNQPIIIKKNEILPRIDQVIIDPYTYLLISKLFLLIKNQIDMGMLASPENPDIPKEFNSSLSNLNNLIFLSFWLKTKNFKNFWFKAQKKENLLKLSVLETTKSSISKLYDYENNEYKGMIKFGKKNGKGKYIFKKNGMAYVGNFVNDLREGKGNFSSMDSSYIYDGEWKDDKYEGNGSLVSIKHGKYVGTFKKGVFEGTGILIDKDNNVFNGMFKNGKKCGKGELNFFNGEKYIGDFKDNKYNGKGELLDSKGNIIQKGVFKDGVLVESNKKKDTTSTQENSDKDKDAKLENVEEKKE